MTPRSALALTIIGLLTIAGIADLGSVASGAFVLRVRGDPVQWQRLTVTFSDIRVHRANAGDASGWTSLPLTTPEIDFMALGNLAQALSLARAAPGKYTQLRIVIDSVDGVLANGMHVTVVVPDGVLKTDTSFNLTGSGSTTITLEFDLARSLHSAHGVWIFRPVLGSVQIG